LLARAEVPVEIVPVTLHLPDGDYLEGVDLTADAWYDEFAPTGADVEVAVTAPSPGQFALAFEALLERGCTEVLSILSAPPLCAAPEVPACSGSVTSARLAAHRAGVPVRVVEVPAAGFALGCCAWVAIEAAAAGATLDDVVARVEAAAPQVRQFFLAAPVPVLRRGTADDGEELTVCSVDRVPGVAAGQVSVVAAVPTVLDAVNVMATAVVTGGSPVRVAIGHGDASVEPVAEALEFAVGETAVVDEVLRYRVGPSSSRLTGAGVVRCFVVPAAAFGPVG
jgi:fatty acid-binding protein DegV